MNGLRIFLMFLLASIVLGSVAVPASAESEEERYVKEITSLLIVADLHLTGARDALLQCLSDFGGCVSDSRLVVARLNISRDGLGTVLNSTASQNVPARYRVVHDLVAQGLRDSISGIGLHVEGLQEGSLEKFEAGSDVTAVGRGELQGAIDLLNSTPPRSEFEAWLVPIIVAIAAASVVSTTGLLLWYRKERRHASTEGRTAKP